MSGLVLPDGTPAARFLHPELDFTPRNRLGEETSPYLLQHANNPVAWQPYSEAAFQEARQRDLPILLSIGYAACHWCHVMERESFENIDVARFMNHHFICIKIDREERPDVDHLYMSAVQMLTGQGGWPLNVFVDWDGKPFFGGTYFPPQPMYGRPSWLQVCEAVSEAWTQQRNDVLSTGKQLTIALQQESAIEAPPGLDVPMLLKRAVDGSLESYDEQFGGIGNAPKFPQPMLLEYLLEYSVIEKNEQARAMVENSLDRMQRGGIFDQIGGGFSRYSTDARWVIPHFEKMLYDNAQLINLYLNASLPFSRNDFLATATSTLDWAIREMWLSDEQGFAASLDADSDGVEGKFYVWSKPAILDALGESRGTRFCDIYGVGDTGNFEQELSALWLERTLTECAQTYSIPVEQLMQELAEDRELLLSLRDRTRNRPARDNKVLTDWNGLMLSALANGHAITKQASYWEHALMLAKRFASEWRETTKLLHSRRGGNATTEEFSLDYAAVANGLFDLYQATGDSEWFVVAIEIAEAINQRFVMPNGSVAQSRSEVAGIRTIDPWDNALPSGNSHAALLWSRLANLTGNSKYRNWAERATHVFAPAALRAPTGLGQLLRASYRLQTVGEQWVIAGEKPDVHAIVFLHYVPHREIAYCSGNPPEQLHELCAGKVSIENRPTLYRCRDFHCEAPEQFPV
ncbi:MAG: thioredoxin domain-containing protein [bacterium]|nr:thioredoxin domain-containing protein [bacterium]